MRTILIAVSVLVALATSSFVQAEDGSRTKEEFLKYVAERLRTADKEFLEKLFKAIDKDGDGRVSAAEFEKRQEALRSLRKKAPEPADRDLDDPEADFDRHARRAAKRDAFPVLDTPAMKKAADSKLESLEPVIGLVVGGEARAYPVAVMGHHELVNDVCGKTPVAVTW